MGNFVKLKKTLKPNIYTRKKCNNMSSGKVLSFLFRRKAENNDYS